MFKARSKVENHVPNNILPFHAYLQDFMVSSNVYCNLKVGGFK